MSASINKSSRVFFWFRKKSPDRSKTLQRNNDSQKENVTIASFWQTQLMNIANDQTHTKHR